jgi:phage gpG-like protein
MAEFQADETAIASLIHEDFVQSDLHDRAERVVRAAKELAPVESGRYRESIHVEDDTDGAVLVVSDVEYAAVIEYGTRDRPAHHVIGTALDAARS